MGHRKYFLSYRRRTDGLHADAIAGELRQRLGMDSVFFDSDPHSLPLGVSWPDEILSNIVACDTLLPVIGPRWLDELEARNRSADGGWSGEKETDDWVRQEILLALYLGKRVVTLLVDGATLPSESQLPPDLRELTRRQVFVFHPDRQQDELVANLVDGLIAKVEYPPAVPMPPLNRPARTPAGIPNQLDDPSGKLWDPRSEVDSPHEYDYKYCILDPDVRDRLRIELLAANQRGELHRGFMLSELKAWGEPRKFSISSIKSGMFIQASCLVTDGMSDGKVSRVLLSIRDNYQIHDPSRLDPRNISEESCLIATCFTDFRVHEGSGHLSKAVLNDLAHPNPWAVFSRKLLIPDSIIDCKFLGVGFNLMDRDKEYVHLVWHVRTRQCPEMMLVPAREKKQHDVPVWQTLEQLGQYDFEKAPIDRHVVEKTFNLHLPQPCGKPKATWMTGFVSFPRFDCTEINGYLPVRWPRDTVPLDLARMFQQKLCLDSIKLGSPSAVEILSKFAEYVRGLIESNQIPVRVEEFSIAHARRPFDRGLRLTVTDEAGQRIGQYLILAIEWLKNNLAENVVARIRERAEMGFGEQEHPKAVILLQGIHTSQRFEIQGAVSLHDLGHTPIHVVRLALGDSPIPIKRIVHAVIPVRQVAGHSPDSLLVTFSPGDEGPRLPGGKIENTESDIQALVRELNEELGLELDEMEVSECVKPEGINSDEISPSTELLTHYRIFTFVVRVLESGAVRLRRRIKQSAPDDACQVWPETFERWMADGLGFDELYPKTVMALITSEQLDHAAMDLM